MRDGQADRWTLLPEPPCMRGELRRSDEAPGPEACVYGHGHDGDVWIGWIECDLLLGDVHSLKTKRAVVRPLVAELRRRFQVAAAETDHLDLHRRAGVGASLVAADHAHVVAVLDRVEQLVADRGEVELLSTRRRIIAADDF